MDIADRLRQLREAQGLSQGDIEKRTGLLRCYISRVENGHTVPALETLEKLAQAYGLKLYQLFYDGNETPPAESSSESLNDWTSHGQGRRLFSKLSRVSSVLKQRDRALLLHLAEKMVRSRAPKGLNRYDDTSRSRRRSDGEVASGA